MEQSNENRKYKRYTVERIHGNVLNITDLDVLNISVEGAAIETSKRLELNREYTFKIKSQNSVLKLRGRVVWAILISKESKDSDAMIPAYRVGIKFTETLSEKADTLINFIEENKIKPFEHRLGGIRFKIADTENFQLDYPYEYKVKKISLSGMLIETQYPLDLNSNQYIELFVLKEQLNIVGRVINCSSKDGAGKYDIGIEFLTILNEDRKILEDFLKKLD